MPIDPHQRFSRMSDAFARAFGETVTFTTGNGEKTFWAIVRAEPSLAGDNFGIGVRISAATLAVDIADAAQLAEGDTFTHSGKTWRIASPGSPDGRAMTLFDIEVSA